MSKFGAGFDTLYILVARVGLEITFNKYLFMIGCHLLTDKPTVEKNSNSKVDNLLQRIFSFNASYQNYELHPTCRSAFM